MGTHGGSPVNKASLEACSRESRHFSDGRFNTSKVAAENKSYDSAKASIDHTLELAVAEGRIKTIGVFNFLKEDIDNILESCRIKPAVNQVLAHISNTPIDLIRYCQEKGIAVEAYSPVAHGEALKNPLIREMAEKYKVTPAQLCIRYCLQLDLITLPKATSEAHLRENAEVGLRQDIVTGRNPFLCLRASC